jgi:hypothetical protein
MEVSCQLHATAAIPPWKEPRYPLDRRLTDGGEVVNITRRPLFTPMKILGTYLC